MEQIQMIYGSCIQAISGDVNMDIKELMRQKKTSCSWVKNAQNHIARVGKGKCDSKLTIPFNDVLHNIDRIGNSCVNLVEVAKENVTMQAFLQRIRACTYGIGFASAGWAAETGRKYNPAEDKRQETNQMKKTENVIQTENCPSCNLMRGFK